MTHPPILLALRTATQDDHQSLEAVTYGDRILAGTLTAEQYRRLLIWQQRSHLALEAQVYGFKRGNYAYRPRFDAAGDRVAQPGLSEQIGLLYVLEGSSLGGSVIHKKLLSNPALREEAPFTFYRQQAEWGVAQWRAFIGFLHTLPPGEVETAAAVRGARRAFARFRSEWEALR